MPIHKQLTEETFMAAGSMTRVERLIIGLGSGRCGTVSLAKIIGMQPECVATHERFRLPWHPDPNSTAVDLAIKSLLAQNAKASSDTGFYWLPHLDLDYYLNEPYEMYCICLQRDRQDTIDSYMRKIAGYDPFRKPNIKAGIKNTSEKNWGKCYPDFPIELTKEEAIGRFWDIYYTEAERLAETYPDNFLLLHMNDFLHDHQVQAEALDFLGFVSPITNTDVWMNQSPTQRT